MRKRIFCLIMATVMVLQLGTVTLAATPKNYDNVETAATIQIAENVKAGTEEITESTGNSVTITKSSSEAFPKFDFLCTLDMESVREKFDFYYESLGNISDYVDRRDELSARLEEMKVSGEFTIEITYPNSLTVPEEFLRSGEMIGFDDNAKKIFGDDTRTLVEGSTENTIKIVVKVVGEESQVPEENRPGYVLGKSLKANIGTYLSDFTLGCENVGTTQYGTFKVTGKMTGFTLVKEDTETVLLKLDYKTPQDAIATCTVKKSSSGNGGGSVITNCTVSFDVDGDKTTVSPVTVPKNKEIKLSELKVPHKDGYVFDGWYTDETLKNKVTDDITIKSDMVLYGSWKKIGNTEKLNDTEHFAYIIGYPEGDVRPNNYITREEIATIFFRLLKDEERNAIMTKENDFADVEAGRWSNTAISTMQNGGYIEGYTDGTFKPEKFITRAEFATIAARLEASGGNVMHGFTDVSGHWAEGYIADAVAKGWIAGYEDGSFKPEQNITRAEAMTIINRMLNRFVNAEGIHKDAILWPDNDKSAWYYYAVEEATNSHEYERQADGVNENWTVILTNRNWSELEK